MRARVAALVCGGCLALAPHLAAREDTRPSPPPRAGVARARPQHYVFFDRDRERIREAAFLDTPAIAGAELKYIWKELEPTRGDYRFSALLADLAFLEAHGKRLFVQLQDVSFDDHVLVPDYLVSDPAFGGGVARQYDTTGDDDAAATFQGWVARRWDPAVQERFALLLRALGRATDGRIEGLVLPETAVGFGETGKYYPPGFRPDVYVEAVKANLSAARQAFPRSAVLQYANFMPGEWLPWTNKGYLQAVYAHAERIGAGVGGPDLMPHRKGQLNHSYPLIAARGPHVLAGVAVQDGNLADKDPATGRRVTVAELDAFARAPLRLDYVFWGTEEPYFTSEVLPYLRALPSR